MIFFFAFSNNAYDLWKSIDKIRDFNWLTSVLSGK